MSEIKVNSENFVDYGEGVSGDEIRFRQMRELIKAEVVAHYEKLLNAHKALVSEQVSKHEKTIAEELATISQTAERSYVLSSDALSDAGEAKERVEMLSETKMDGYTVLASDSDLDNLEDGWYHLPDGHNSFGEVLGHNYPHTLYQTASRTNDDEYTLQIAMCAKSIMWRGSPDFPSSTWKKITLEVIDNLETADSKKPLSANQGKVLHALIDGVDGRVNDAIAFTQTVEADMVRSLKTKANAKVWETISTITVEPDIDGNLPNAVTISLDSNGETFNLDSFEVSCKLGVSATTNLVVRVNDNVPIWGNSKPSSLSSSLRNWLFRFDKMGESTGGLFSGAATTIAATSSYHNTNNFDIIGAVVPNFGNTTAVTIACQASSATFVDGTTFTLKGVRA